MTKIDRNNRVDAWQRSGLGQEDYYIKPTYFSTTKNSR
jgi:hypothetical protein